MVSPREQLIRGVMTIEKQLYVIMKFGIFVGCVLTFKRLQITLQNGEKMYSYRTNFLLSKAC
jgi:hypothetical protein